MKVPLGRRDVVTPEKMNTNNLKHIFVNILCMMASNQAQSLLSGKVSMNLKICV